MTDERAIVFSSDAGWICAAWRGQMLCELTFGHSSPERAVQALRLGIGTASEPAGPPRQFAQRLQEFLRCPADDFLDIELDLSSHTPFQRRVLRKCRQIPIGETISYAELAERAGHPGAARAAGQVMATNQFPLVVPCHRVVASGGSLGGYSAPDGLQMKRRLLALESQALIAR
jgi:methylated-DNA-[protein]-cysteine S-methyltransferase